MFLNRYICSYSMPRLGVYFISLWWSTLVVNNPFQPSGTYGTVQDHGFHVTPVPIRTKMKNSACDLWSITVGLSETACFSRLDLCHFAVTGGVRRTVWEENEEAQRTGRLHTLRARHRPLDLGGEAGSKPWLSELGWVEASWNCV